MANSDKHELQVQESLLTEPAPTPPLCDGHVYVQDGLDNSDLRLLLDLATKSADIEE